MKKLFVILAAAAAIFSAVSCKDFLEPTQIDLIYNEAFWESQADAEVGVTGIYSLYRGLMSSGTNWYQRGDVTCGFVKAGWSGGSSSNYYTIGNYTDISSTNKMWGSLDSEADWGRFYKVIAEANLVISKILAMDKAEFNSTADYNRLLGEAYFMRALTYFNVLRIWGNAPLITDAIESSSQVIDKDHSPLLIGRSSDFEIASQVFDDVEQAIALLDYGTYGTANWGIRANKGSALELYAHVNMWMNFLAKRDRLPEPLKYVQNAISALEDLRDNGGYSYVDYSNADAVKAMFNGQSTEAVFELYVGSENNESYRADQSGVQSYTCKLVPFDGDPTHDRATNIDWIPYNQKPNLYPEYNFATGGPDIRPHLFFGAWDSTYNEPCNDTQGSTTNDRSKVTWLTKWAQFTEDTERKQDAYIAYFAECNIPVFRYTDAMLLLAEAYCKNSEQAKALPIVNDIRHRAGLGDYTGADLITEVLQERISELFGEGHLYFDFVRNNYWPNEHLMGSVKYRQKGYYWPVSSNVLSTNTLIDQTPYWNGKCMW